MLRKLTQKEINGAPDWATHYCITEHGTAHFERVGVHHNLEGKPMTLDNVPYLPIPRKEFDISGYEFSDNAILSAYIDGGVILNFDYETSGIELSKQDIISLAKGAKLTAGDLNDAT